jgi:hypothetical protein
VRPTLAVLIAAAAGLASAPPASAHGGEIITKAIAGLHKDSVYVDPTSVPTIAPADADQLRERIRGAGGRIYVAVLPADAQHELPTARAVLDEIAAAIGGDSTYAVLVGGQFRAASVDRPEDARELEAGLVAETAVEPADRLLQFVDGMDEARSGGSSGSLAVVAGVVGAAALALAATAFLVLVRRRRSPPARPESAV